VEEHGIVSIPILEIRQPGRRPLQVVVSERLDIGRACDGILLADPDVSRRHAELSREGDTLMIRDLGSTNGTSINGSRISGAVRMIPDDVVKVGLTELRLVYLPTEAETPESASGAAPAADAVVKAHAGGDDDIRLTSIERVADSVEENLPDIQSLRGDGDTVTIVFSDIESSTEMTLGLGDSKWFEVLGAHNEVIRRHLKAYGGTEIKSQGDGFMLTFPSTRRAVQFCIDVQRELAGREREDPETAIRIRIGLHTGEAIMDESGDLFGKHIIVAARVANLADGREILCSNVVREIASSRGDLDFGEPREVQLKGISGTTVVHQVLWEESEET
jgi:class 3 adenylate cyclase